MRYYEQKFPEVDDLVMVQVKQIAEMGAYVKLLEYDELEGMILMTELSRRRIRSIQKLIRVGRNEAVVVLRVDKAKGYIDLSKRQVSAEDAVACTERYNSSKAVNQVLRHVCERTGHDIETIYEKIAWPLAKKFKHANEAFKLAVQDPAAVYPMLDLPADIDKELRAQVEKRYSKQDIKFRADVAVTCYSYEGVDAIKASLAAAQATQTEEHPINIKLVAPPLFVLTTSSPDREDGVAVLQKALDVLDEAIKSRGGSMTVSMAPKAITQVDDNELAALLRRAEDENRLVSGDDDSDAE